MPNLKNNNVVLGATVFVVVLVVIAFFAGFAWKSQVVSNNLKAFIRPQGISCLANLRQCNQFMTETFEECKANAQTIAKKDDCEKEYNENLGICKDGWRECLNRTPSTKPPFGLGG